MAEKMKIYIVQKKSGRTDEEILWERLAAVESVAVAMPGYAIRTAPALVHNLEREDVWNLGKDIQQMEGADMVILLPGWEEEASCRVEKMCADYFGKASDELMELGDGFEYGGGQASMKL